MGRGFPSAAPWDAEEAGSSDGVTPPWLTLPLETLSTAAAPPGWLYQEPRNG